MAKQGNDNQLMQGLKTKLLQVRVDETTIQTLDECAVRFKTTRSEIVRKGIAQIHKHQWIPATEPPDDGINVLVVTASGRYDFAFYTSHLKAWFDRELWFSDARRTGFEDEVVTHWQPLPPMPL